MNTIKGFIYKKLGFVKLVQKSKNWYLPGFKGICAYDVLHYMRSHIVWQSLTERAAAISYNVIMAIPPSLLFLFTIIPSLPFIPKESIKIQLHDLIYDVIPARVNNKDIIAFVDQFIDNTRVGLISFGLLLSLFFASNAMMGFIRSFNRDYLGFEKRKGLKQRGIAIKLTCIIFGLLLLYLLLLITQGKILDMLVHNAYWRNIINYSRWFLIVLLVYFGIAFIFRYAPAVEKRWSIFSPGGTVATILSLTSTLGFALFVNNFGRYNALYGAIGTIMVITALIFINCLALLIGFELNVSINSVATIKKRNAPKPIDE